MTTLVRGCTPDDVRAALDTVVGPELDEPITDLGFVTSTTMDDRAVTVHLRLPTSFCSPNFAYLMASDAKDALVALCAERRDPRTVVVELDDHHDSELINAGLAADAGYKGTFRHEAEQGLDELRLTFFRKAHTAAMERALTAWIRRGGSESTAHTVTVADLPDDPTTDALLRRRTSLGLTNVPTAQVLLDEDLRPVPAEAAVARLRRARSVRISVDGNAHFCRGLLATRYPGAEADQAPRASIDRPLLPLLERTSA